MYIKQPMKQGHLSNQDTLNGLKGVRIRGVQLYCTLIQSIHLCFLGESAFETLTSRTLE